MNRIFNRDQLLVRPWLKIRQSIDAAIQAPDALSWLTFMFLAANALAYLVMYANPLIQSDAWYFLDVFIRKAFDGHLHLGDFFVQRGGMDHAQPLRKLILLADLKYFNLDFRYEAVAGWLGAIVSLMTLRRLVLWHTSPEQPVRGVQVWIWAALSMVLFSMNSFVVWVWPLMTGSFTSFALLFVTILMLWRWLALGRPTGFIVSVLAFDLAADDTAILANIACLIALGIVFWQNPPWRRRALIVASTLIASLVVVRISYALLFTPPVVAGMPLGTRLEHLWSLFIGGGWWQWLIVPLASSVAQIQTARVNFGHHAQTAQIIIGLLLLLAHGWFWWRVLWKRPKITAAGFAAIVVMLLFYAMLAGIIYGRVTAHGNTYLHQPRYVLLYSFNLVALLLMLAACDWNSLQSRRFLPATLVAIITLFACWQMPLAKRAWQTGPYIRDIQEKMAWQIGELARHPESVPDHCLPQLVVCRYPKQKRIQLLKLMKTRQLNVFSPRFRHTTRLDPDQAPK